MIELLYSALHSPKGIKVRSSDRLFLRQKLYEARQELSDDELKNLAFAESPSDPEHLWIVKKSQGSG